MRLGEEEKGKKKVENKAKRDEKEEEECCGKRWLGEPVAGCGGGGGAINDGTTNSRRQARRNAKEKTPSKFQSYSSIRVTVNLNAPFFGFFFTHSTFIPSPHSYNYTCVPTTQTRIQGDPKFCDNNSRISTKLKDAENRHSGIGTSQVQKMKFHGRRTNFLAIN